VRALVLLPLGADQVHRGDDRHEDPEGAPVAVLDLYGERQERKGGKREPDDAELEGRRSRVETGEDWVVSSGAH